MGKNPARSWTSLVVVEDRVVGAWLTVASSVICVGSSPAGCLFLELSEDSLSMEDPLDDGGFLEADESSRRTLLLEFSVSSASPIASKCASGFDILG